MRNTKTYKWAYLPIVLSSVAILATQVSATPQQAQQVKNLNYNYVGGGSNVGVSINDEGDTTFDMNAVLSEDKNSMTSGGLWAGVDLGKEADVHSGGARLDHNWVVRDKQGKADHINKVYGAYDRDKNDNAKLTAGFGQEVESGFWEGHVSKGLSHNKKAAYGSTVAKTYAHGAGVSAGKYVAEHNVRVRSGLDYQWSGDDDEATLLSLSAGVEKFFQGTPHSVGLDVSAHKKSNDYKAEKSVRGNVNYRYNFAGDDAFQPDRRYRRVRVEVAGKGRAPRYKNKPIYANRTKKVPTYGKRTTKVPVYGKKTVKSPYKQLVKSTMELEGQTFFKLNRADLIPSAQQRLKQIAAQIRKNGYKGAIRITGNTCKLGDTQYDQRLSEQRAASVRRFLIREGFNPKHLLARGVGKSNPKYPTTPDQDFKNRRVDIEYVSEQSVYKTRYRNVNKRVQTGTRTISKKVRTGTRTVTKRVKVGHKRVMVDKGAAGTPRVVWRTEVIPTAPTWIKRALHNTIKHSRRVDTYLAMAGNPVVTQGATITAQDFSQTIEQSTNYVVNVTHGATGDNVTLQSFTQGSNGTVTEGQNAGELIYTPNAGFTGTDSCTFTLVDKNGNTATATVTIIVTGSSVVNSDNKAPVATNDNATTNKNEEVWIPLINNDIDHEGKGIKVTAVTQGAHGQVVISGDDGVDYQPKDGFVGTDTFTYTITDASGDTSTATVTVTVEDYTAVTGGSCCTVNIPVTIGGSGDSFMVLGENDSRTLTSVTSSVGYVEVDTGDTSKHTLFFEPEGHVGTATITYQLSDGSSKTISIECYKD